MYDLPLCPGCPLLQTEPTRRGEGGAATRGHIVTLGVLFFLSGALGLIYEIVWFRRLHLALGVSIFAVGAVVSAFMLGLALGSRWAAGSAWLRRSPLIAFGALELGIGAYALAFPLLIAGLEALYPVLFRLWEGQFLTLASTRFVLAFGLLLPPTFLMGASLPTVAEAAAASPGRRARTVAGLYALNTAGGVAGTVAAGFVLIEHLGLTGSLRVAATGSSLVALSAFLLSRHRAPRTPFPTAEVAPVEPQGSVVSAAVGALAVTAALVAGTASLAAELVWTRALVFFVHNSTYAFSAILAVYLVGIALGALLATFLVRTTGGAVRALATSLAAGSISLVAAIAVYQRLPEVAAALAGQPPAPPTAVPEASLVVWDWSTALVMIFGQVAAVLLLPALFLGTVFPLTLKIADADGTPTTRLVGRLYAVNTLGSVVGAVAGTFVLVALLGTRGARLFVAWLPVPVALWALWKAAACRPMRMVGGGLLLATKGVGSLTAAPAGFYRQLFAQRFGPVAWFSEGIPESVAVCDHEDGSRWIQFSDGRGASGTRSQQGGWLYAHIPLLLHPDPHSVAVVCFGTGNTLGAASRHPLKAIDGIELSPEVVKAAPLFAKTNHDVLEDEGVRIVIEDGRSCFLATNRTYDTISEEPPLVHTAGVVNLYSRDFYELCARHLTEDGLMAVWLATWELEPREMRMLVRAFVDVFPWASVWDCTHDYEWVLVGSKTAPRLDLDALAARMRAPLLARDLVRIDPQLGGVRTPADLLSLYLMGRDAMVAFAGDAPPVTDDRSVVDFTSPRHARSNFGLGEWVTGGLRTFGVGRGGLISELRLRKFDRIYTMRESPADLVGNFGARDRTEFLAEVRGQAWARELRATRLTLEALRQVAMEHLVAGRAGRGLEESGLEGGYVVFPNMQGVLIPSRYDAGFMRYGQNVWQALMDVNLAWSFESGMLNMPWFGASRGGSSILVRVDTPSDARLHVIGNAVVNEAGEVVDASRTRNPGTRLSSLGPIWWASHGRLAYPRRIRVEPVADGYVGMAKRYREHARESGRLVTLKEKIRRVPDVEKLIGAPDVKIYVFTNRLDDPYYRAWSEPILDGYSRVHMTFEQVAEMAADLAEMGVEKCLVLLAGWNRAGYDREHPDTWPPAAGAGGAEGLRRAAQAVEEKGLTIPLFHLVYHDCVVGYWQHGMPFGREDHANHVLHDLLTAQPSSWSLIHEQWEDLKPLIQETYALLGALHEHTPHHPMVDHEVLTADFNVQRSEFADGTVVRVNYGITSYRDGHTRIPPKGFEVRVPGEPARIGSVSRRITE